MTRLQCIIVGIGLLSLAMSLYGATYVEEDVAVRLHQLEEVQEGAPFWCGTTCYGEWKRVATCLSPQICCGWWNCYRGIGVNTCCTPPQECNYDHGVSPPAAPACAVYP
ncbi:MAG: hypothetical protein KIT68_12925 [Phycisphaeraceae bacterium]|nr:hypothetical protein [Phycisphaeraceae bacterium]